MPLPGALSPLLPRPADPLSPRPCPCPAAAQLPGLAALKGSGATLNLGTIKPCSMLVRQPGCMRAAAARAAARAGAASACLPACRPP